MNACGSFYVIAFVADEGPVRTGREPAAVFPLVLVDALVGPFTPEQHIERARWTIKGYDGKFYPETSNDASVLMFRSGEVGADKAAVQLSARVKLLGGGKDGSVGAAKVCGGWVSNVVEQQRIARYDGGGTVVREFVCAAADVLKGSLGFGPILKPQDKVLPLGPPAAGYGARKGLE